MTYQFFNRVSFLATTSGLVDFGVGAASTGYRTPAAAGVADGTQVSYTATSGASWEVGLGVYSSSTVQRTTIRASSNSNAKVNFASPPTVWFDLHAEDAIGGFDTGIQFNDQGKLNASNDFT